jgi:hypothetical protein
MQGLRCPYQAKAEVRLISPLAGNDEGMGRRRPTEGLRRSVTMLAVGLVGGGVLACGATSGTLPTSGTAHLPQTVVDERSGSVDGVTLGDSRRAIRRALGPGRDRQMLRIIPEHVDFTSLGLPWTEDPVPGVRMRDVVTMRRDGLSLLVAPHHGAYAIFVWRRGAQTTRGIEVGDDLETVPREYEDFRCGVRNRTSEYPSYPYCTGRVGDTYIWFGQDPIRSITVASTPVG